MFFVAQAQPSPPSGELDYGEFFKWMAVLIVVLMILSVVVMWIRKRISADEKASGGGAGFTLSDFRKLHKEGKMTDEEFEKAKALIVGNYKKPPPSSSTSSPQKPASPRGGEDRGPQ